MNVRVDRDEDIVVGELSGPLDARGAREIEVALAEIVAPGGLRVILDCARVTLVTGAGIHGLMLLATRLGHQHSALALCVVPDAVLKVLDVSGFANRFTIVPTALDAIAQIPPYDAHAADAAPGSDRQPLDRLSARVRAALRLDATDADPDADVDADAATATAESGVLTPGVRSALASRVVRALSLDSHASRSSNARSADAPSSNVSSSSDRG